jgi:tryptophanyl-tRNA synthetase
MPSPAIAPLVFPQDLEPLFPARVVSGVQPSAGGIHLGNYFGAVATHVRLQNEYPGDAFYLIADYHALTTQHNGDLLRNSTADIALDYLGAGIDPVKSTLYRQSDVPQLCELMWVLMCATRKSRLDKAHAYQTATSHGKLPSVGLFLYPALMAADILALRGTDVPVGHDQQQHLEITRDIARSFNSLWGSVFPIPYLRPTTTPIVPGIDGEKMSKSYDNTLPVFWDDEEWFEARVKHIVTASTALGDAIDPETSTVFSLYRLVAPADKVADMRTRLADGTLGFSEAKQALLSALTEYFTPLHERRRELASEPDYVEDILRDGARRVREEAEVTLDAVRGLAGLSPYRRRLL